MGATRGVGAEGVLPGLPAYLLNYYQLAPTKVQVCYP